MNCRTPDFPFLNHLPEFVQTHVHWVSDAIQPSHIHIPNQITLHRVLQTLCSGSSWKRGWAALSAAVGMWGDVRVGQKHPRPLNQFLCEILWAKPLVNVAAEVGMLLCSSDFMKKRNYASEQNWWDLPIDIDDELFEDTGWWIHPVTAFGRRYTVNVC